MSADRVRRTTNRPTATAGAAGPAHQASLFASAVRGARATSNGQFPASTENLPASMDVADHDRITVRTIDNLLDINLPIRLSLNH